MQGLYKVDQIANFMIVYASITKKPITNLQLQKFLYFLWIDYYRKHKKFLFCDEFSAWRFGPVIPDVYYRFCVYGGLPITESIDVKLDNKEAANEIRVIVDKYSKEDPFSLVKETHHKDGAWDSIFNKNGNGSGNHTPIPFSLIIDKECGIRV